MIWDSISEICESIYIVRTWVDPVEDWSVLVGINPPTAIIYLPVVIIEVCPVVKAGLP